MITIVLLDHNDDAANGVADLLCAQDDQNFEILSALSQSLVSDLIDDCTGDYIWFIPPHHTPAQSQTFKKINRIATLHHPDVMSGYFILQSKSKQHSTKPSLHKPSWRKALSTHPLSSHLFSRRFIQSVLLKKYTDLVIDEILDLTDRYARIKSFIHFPIISLPKSIYTRRTKFNPASALHLKLEWNYIWRLPWKWDSQFSTLFCAGNQYVAHVPILQA